MTEITYKDLLAQRQALDAKIAEARKAEAAEALNKVRQLVADYELTVDEVSRSPKTNGVAAQPRAALLQSNTATPKPGKPGQAEASPLAGSLTRIARSSPFKADKNEEMAAFAAISYLCNAFLLIFSLV